MARNLGLIVLCLTLLTGCWDHQEIQQRGYILGVAIDKAHPLPKGQEPEKSYMSERDLEVMPTHRKNPEYSFTIELPVIALAKSQPTGSTGGGGEGAASWELTIRGNSFMEVNREFSTRLDYPPFYEHLQAIVISEDVARQGISRVLDLFLRDHEMRRRTKIFIAPGEAKKILDVKPRISDYPAIYLAALPFNADRTSRLLHKTDLGEVSQSLHTKTDFVLPRVIASKDEVKDAGSAVFKGDKMVGWLGEIDTAYMKIIRDSALGGVIVVDMPGNPEAIVTLEIRKINTKVRPIITEHDIKMRIETEVTFNQAEKTEAHFRKSLDEAYLKALERKAENLMEAQMKDTVKYVQDEFGADVFHFNVIMQRYAPDTWDQVKDRWHEIFTQIETEVHVKAKVEQIGTMK
ncbi:spore germination protein [Anaerosolibacter carboniphilus]|uniref:Spore germination protein n=1 Tax=Anaerosolibacter carboniphilus TaxID=1417629 RepID=A0A841KT24_9FIRM|nr:Ger(x)C family spore germination protein [Anaerosolibacter carboniphilus]MBB6216746.1 spore germination protein [Anaerosolibacter carboniphilus]